MEGAQAVNTNHGNFWALLNFLILAGDNLEETNFKEQLQIPHTHPLVSRISRSTHIPGDHVSDAIIRKVYSSLCYTLIADEVTDCYNKEQLCITIT